MSAKIKAGEAYVRLGTMGSLKAGLRKAGRELAGFAANVAKVGAGISAALAGAGAASVASFARAGTELHKLSTQTGATVEELSRLQFAAKKLQIDPDDLTGAIEELNIRIGETVRDGIGPAAEAFQQLGLDANELARLPVAERLKAISAALAGIGNNTKRGFLADEIFGGDAFKILPLIRQGAEGIGALADEADRLGATVTTSQAASAAELMGLWENVKAAIGGVIKVVGSELTPVLLAIWDVASPNLMKLKGFFEDSGADVFGKAVAKSAFAFDSVMMAFQAIRKVFNMVKIALNSVILLAVRGFEKLVDAINASIDSLIKTINKIPGIEIEFRMDRNNSISQFLDAMGTNLQREITDIAEENLRLSRESIPSIGNDVEKAISDRQEAAVEMDRKAQEQAAPSAPDFIDQYKDLWARLLVFATGSWQRWTS